MLLSFLLSLFFLTSTALGGPIEGSMSSSDSNLAAIARSNSNENGDYIVVLHDDVEVDHVVGSLDLPIANSIVHRYTKVLKGFSGNFDTAQLAAIRALPGLKYIDDDGMAYTVAKESNATYNLAITSGKGKLAPRNQTTYYYKRLTDAPTIYVIDTGIDVGDSQFGGRATFGPDFTGEGRFDGNGHGTHVAGIAGSETYGVFKEVQLVAVKVLDSAGSGQISTIIAGIEWVSKNHKKVSVINMSLASNSKSRALNDATNGAYKAGVTVAVASGNYEEYGQDACDISPASTPSALTVGAIGKNYQVASFSSEGPCVDLHAPGLNVLSTFPGNSTAILSGTSMASPHVAGVAAYLASEFGLTEPEDVSKMVLKYAQKGLLTNLGGAPNVLVNNGYFF